MSLIQSEYIEPFSDCLIKSFCKIFDVKVTNTHCCSLAKNDPNGKIQGLIKTFECFSSIFQGKFYFQGLFETLLLLYLQVLFKTAGPQADSHEIKGFLYRLF